MSLTAGSSPLDPSALSRQIIALALVLAMVFAGGCTRSEEVADYDNESDPIYELAEYDMAEISVKRQLRERLEREEVELRDFWLGLRPVAGDVPELSADVDAYVSRDQAEEVSGVVAAAILEALPRHDEVQVRVYWWGRTEGDSFANLAGAWTWNSAGEIVRHIRPEEIEGAR